ncbi:ATP-dependent DNA helicase PIF1-like [Arachis ipaensis]|uniref:ATP-dependent DNA helicase PIF1-like n=1 Tax=Arachis ipaensis TaxID=130454 RepID=UPI0007AFD8DA|nr:ATP-dependent DNA helicase PIF1-like [Arachis ipaensis]
MSDDEIKQLCLMDIDKILHSYGKTLKDYPPMPLATEVDNSLLTERVIREELNFNRDDLKKNASDMLAITTPEQRYAFDKIVTAVYCDEGGFFFVYGHGGTGKTFLWNLMSAEIRSRGNIESQLDLYGPELLNSINCSGLPPHKLILKVGVPVMLLRNIDQSSGLCNGTRLQVRKLGNHVIECEVLTGNNVGHIALIPRMNMVPTNETVPVRFQRRQFPIIVSFAMTINKSQGQTLSHVGLYLPGPVFTHGQLYVALSRVKSKRGLKVLLMNHVGMSANSTINVVYREVFEKIVF